MPGADQLLDRPPAGGSGRVAAAARALTPYGLLHSWNRFRRQRAAHRAELGEPPERLVLILCNPRSGSTWLLDALRCHPAIELHPRYTVFARLGCVGRRYPMDLASAAEGAGQVEVELGRWAGVPAFTCAAGEVPAAVQAAPYAIEKIHPHFFAYDERGFLARLAVLERRVRVEMIYLTREPQAALRSFQSYQRRNPRWNAQVGAHQAPRHMRRMYETLLRTALRRPGLVIDYDDLTMRFAPTLARIFARLWPQAGVPASPDLLGAIAGATARAARTRAETAFIGARPPQQTPPLAGAELERCLAAWRRLRALDAAGAAGA